MPSDSAENAGALLAKFPSNPGYASCTRRPGCRLLLQIQRIPGAEVRETCAFCRACSSDYEATLLPILVEEQGTTSPTSSSRTSLRFSTSPRSRTTRYYGRGGVHGQSDLSKDVTCNLLPRAVGLRRWRLPAFLPGLCSPGAQ